MTDKLLIDKSLIDGWLDGGGTAEFIDALQNLPPAKMLDLEGALVYSTWGVTLEPDQKWIKESDLTDLVVPTIGREELVDMIANESDAYKLADAILDRIKGLTK